MTMRSETARGTDPYSEGHAAGATTALVAPTQQSRGSARRSGPTVALFGIEIDQVSVADAVAILLRWLDDKLSSCRYVVTPNVHHIVHLQSNPRLRQAYADASLVIADGWLLVAFSRLFKNSLPERVPGSDFVPQLFAAAKPERPLRTFLLGAEPGVAERAAKRIKQKWSNVTVVGTHSPKLGFEHDARRCAEILQLVADAAPDLLVVGFGAPGSGCTPISSTFPLRQPLREGPRSIFLRVSSRGLRVGFNASCWNGYTESEQIRAASYCDMCAMHGTFRT
jgi:UDP-N-acetyl-D-mannosaminuronic acid transferase (WecB/TagA/CpsF family)